MMMLLYVPACTKNSSCKEEFELNYEHEFLQLLLMDCSVPLPVSLDLFLRVKLIPCAAQLRIMKLSQGTNVAFGFDLQKTESLFLTMFSGSFIYVELIKNTLPIPQAYMLSCAE